MKTRFIALNTFILLLISSLSVFKSGISRNHANNSSKSNSPNISSNINNDKNPIINYKSGQNYAFDSSINRQKKIDNERKDKIKVIVNNDTEDYNTSSGLDYGYTITYNDFHKGVSTQVKQYVDGNRRFGLRNADGTYSNLYYLGQDDDGADEGSGNAYVSLSELFNMKIQINGSYQANTKVTLDSKYKQLIEYQALMSSKEPGSIYYSIEATGILSCPKICLVQHWIDKTTGKKQDATVGQFGVYNFYNTNGAWAISLMGTITPIFLTALGIGASIITIKALRYSYELHGIRDLFSIMRGRGTPRNLFDNDGNLANRYFPGHLRDEAQNTLRARRALGANPTQARFNIQDDQQNIVRNISVDVSDQESLEAGAVFANGWRDRLNLDANNPTHVKLNGAFNTESTFIDAYPTSFGNRTEFPIDSNGEATMGEYRTKLTRENWNNLTPRQKYFITRRFGWDYDLSDNFASNLERQWFFDNALAEINDIPWLFNDVEDYANHDIIDDTVEFKNNLSNQLRLYNDNFIQPLLADFDNSQLANGDLNQLQQKLNYIRRINEIGQELSNKYPGQFADIFIIDNDGFNHIDETIKNKLNPPQPTDIAPKIEKTLEATKPESPNATPQISRPVSPNEEPDVNLNSEEAPSDEENIGGEWVIIDDDDVAFEEELHDDYVVIKPQKNIDIEIPQPLTLKNEELNDNSDISDNDDDDVAFEQELHDDYVVIKPQKDIDIENPQPLTLKNEELNDNSDISDDDDYVNIGVFTYPNSIFELDNDMNYNLDIFDPEIQNLDKKLLTDVKVAGYINNGILHFSDKFTDECSKEEMDNFIFQFFNNTSSEYNNIKEYMYRFAQDSSNADCSNSQVIIETLDNEIREIINQIKNINQLDHNNEDNALLLDLRTELNKKINTMKKYKNILLRSKEYLDSIKLEYNKFETEIVRQFNSVTNKDALSDYIKLKVELINEIKKYKYVQTEYNNTLEELNNKLFINLQNIKTNIDSHYMNDDNILEYVEGLNVGYNNVSNICDRLLLLEKQCQYLQENSKDMISNISRIVKNLDFSESSIDNYNYFMDGELYKITSSLQNYDKFLCTRALLLFYDKKLFNELEKINILMNDNVIRENLTIALKEKLNNINNLRNKISSGDGSYRDILGNKEFNAYHTLQDFGDIESTRSFTKLLRLLKGSYRASMTYASLDKLYIGDFNTEPRYFTDFMIDYKNILFIIFREENIEDLYNY